MTALIIIAVAFAAALLAVPALCWNLMLETHERRFAGVAARNVEVTRGDVAPASLMPASMSVPALSVSF